ncbi:MAG: thiamine-phosphate kinase [Rhodocyclales bacterium]|nr:thiamine-phosphate kinase [Rhodocyclales bacterium]
MPSEFDLIRRFFTRLPRHALLGVGDDGALLAPTAGCELVVSADMLVEGTHFLPDTDPEALGWKTLAVNLSDIAAMGALPRWALLAAVLPAPARCVPAGTFDWLEAFARGFFACATAFDVDLVGGDTTRGPRAFCVTILGEAPAGQALRRSGAQPGDSIWVSGRPGRAALGLAHLQGRVVLAEPQLSACLAALHRPQPRVALGLALRGLAHAAIDVSDGLLADLGHILDASGCAAHLSIPGLPPPGIERDCFLAGGDDYELVFTAPAEVDDEVMRLGQTLPLALTRIGEIVTGAAGSFILQDAEAQAIVVTRCGFDHFQN